MPDDAVLDAAVAWTPGEIAWTPCALPGDIDGACAMIDVPADWDDVTGTALSAHLGRVPAANSRGQVWVLAGGPGQAGSSLAVLATSFPNHDLYLLDFRGTGASSYLDCDAELSRDDFAACATRLRAEWGPTLDHFTTTASARDLGMLIDALRGGEEEEVLIYGASFGTYWANRYLQLYPDQADGMILEGLCSPGRCDYSVFQDEASNDVARTLFDLCAADAVCNEKLGGDPWGFVGDLFDLVSAGGHCPDLEADGDSLRWYIATAMYHPQARDFLPAVLYRFARCEAGDIAAIEHYNSLAFVGFIGPNAVGEFSDPLRLHVVLSELLPDPPPTLAEIEALHETLYATGDESKLFASLADAWPRYPREDIWPSIATTDIPMLMLQGTMDPATTLTVAEPFAETFTGENQRYVPLTGLTHGVLWHPCAQSLVEQFVANPTVALDTACTLDLEPPRFDHAPQWTMHWLGTSDAWENTP